MPPRPCGHLRETSAEDSPAKRRKESKIKQEPHPAKEEPQDSVKAEQPEKPSANPEDTARVHFAVEQTLLKEPNGTEHFNKLFPRFCDVFIRLPKKLQDLWTTGDLPANKDARFCVHPIPPEWVPSCLRFADGTPVQLPWGGSVVQCRVVKISAGKEAHVVPHGNSPGCQDGMMVINSALLVLARRAFPGLKSSKVYWHITNKSLPTGAALPFKPSSQTSITCCPEASGDQLTSLLKRLNEYPGRCIAFRKDLSLRDSPGFCGVWIIDFLNQTATKYKTQECYGLVPSPS